MTVVTVSIVSHGQGKLVSQALDSLNRVADCTPFEVIITKNLPEKIDYPAGLHVVEVANLRPRGFAQNHNHAFEISRGEYFCVLNPDVSFREDVFGYLIEKVASNPRAVVAPVVRNGRGRAEDSFRRDVTFWRLVKRKLLGWQDYDYEGLTRTSVCIEPDFIAGVFLLMPRAVYGELKGFDEAYWMYFEDADFGRRARKLGIVHHVYTAVQIDHVGQRAGRHSLWYLLLHLRSTARYLWGI